MADIGKPVSPSGAALPVNIGNQATYGDGLKTTAESVFLQSMPRFEIIISKSEADCGAIPKKWLGCENVVVLSDEGFIKAAKKAARSEKVIVFKKEYRLDARLFKFVQNLGLPEAIKNRFFGLLVRASQKAAELKKI